MVSENAPATQHAPRRIQLKRTKVPCRRCCSNPSVQGQRGYCGPECRFWALVVKASTCWNWTGALSARGGYGRFNADGVRWLAHRYAYTLLAGPIPEGHELDHLCKVTRCVNPEHVEPVTSDEHVRRSDQGAYLRARTHCPHGHEYTPENTRISGTRRHCRECGRLRTINA